MKYLNPKMWWIAFLDWKTERFIRKCFKVRNDMAPNPSVNVPIEIIKGKYKGLIYQYGAATIKENNVEYQYMPIEDGHLIDEDFVRFAGNILTYLITKRQYYDVITRNDGS
jgi:hypothetical protein